MEFGNKTVIGRRELTALARGKRLSSRRRGSRMARSLTMFLVALNVLLAWGRLRIGDGLWWLNGSLALFLLVLTATEDALEGWLRGRRLPEESREVSALFGEERYLCVTRGGQAGWHYPQIRFLCESRDYFLLYLTRGEQQVYAKSGFTQGTPEAFRDFIEEKTGLTAKQI